MNVKTVLIKIGFLGFIAVFCGCQRPLCPHGAELAKTGQLREAVDVYLQCRGVEKNSKRRSELNDRIKALTPKIVNPVLDQWNKEPPTTVSQYNRAISDLQDIRPYDEAVVPRGVAQKMAKYETELQKLKENVREWCGAAVEHKDKHEWKQAAESIDKALAGDPDNLAAKELARTILKERNNYYRNQIETLCEKDQWKEADETLARFSEEAPEQKDTLLKELTERVRGTKTKAIRRQVLSDIGERESDIGGKAYFRAYTLLEEEKPDNCDDLMKRIVKEGTRYYQALAETMKRDANDYEAYLAIVKAAKLLGIEPDPTRPEVSRTDAPRSGNYGSRVFELNRDYGRFIDDAIRAEICIAAFDCPASDAAVGKEFADRLATDFFQQLPYGLRLDDRRRVEYARVQAGLGVRDALQLVGVTWLVQGSVSMKFVKDRHERDKTAWVPIEKTITNPHYDSEIEEFRTRYGKDMAKWPRRPSHTITQKLTETVTYKVGTEQMEGEIAVSVSIYSNTEGTITDANSFRQPRIDTADFCFSDAIKPVGDPSVKIDPPKPLKMISELKFKEELEQQVREQVVRWLLRSFGSREERFLKEADDSYRQGEHKRAIEAAAKGYFYCLKADPSNVSMSSYADLVQLALIDLTEEASWRSASAMGENPVR